MDTRSLLEEQGEDGVRRRVKDVVDLVGARSIFQIGLFGPEHEAYAKARQYMKLAADGGVPRFALFASPERLGTTEWTSFYGDLER